MQYDGYTVLESWKKVVNEGIVDSEKIRPEIARAWSRCLSYGLDPWSSDFAKTDEVLLRRTRERYKGIMDAAASIMQYLLTFFNCNVSIADMHAFVFDLITPLSAYPRTLGTFVTEALNGSGNLPMALAEKKPIRLDGYEHFRAVSQNYSGVAAFIHGKETFVLCMNEPFSSLPKNALDVCIAAGRLIEKLNTTRREAFTHLSSATFFDPILDSDHAAVIVTNEDGMILTANASARPLVPDYESAPYASKSLGDYMKSKQVFKALLDDSQADLDNQLLVFKGAGQRRSLQARLLRCKHVTLMNGMKNYIYVFENQTYEEEKPVIVRESETQTVDYIGQSPAWMKVDELVRGVAAHKSNVIVMGDTGTGKEVVARALHRMSGRKGEFVAINCGALPRDLLASELFGYEGGAFTGARSSGAKGKFEYANGGTLFLDEIGDMPFDMQVSLLRVLQEQTVTRIGANKPISFDVRVIAATNQNMDQLIARGKFRSDLWYRLSVIEIFLPRLQDRGNDVILMAEHFNSMLTETLNVREHPLLQDVQEFLLGYTWPGNVRELKNIMEKALIMAGGRPLTIDCFPEYMKTRGQESPRPILNAENFKPPQSQSQPRPTREDHRLLRDEFEREKIITLMEQEHGNISSVAKRMGISRNTLYRHIKRLDIKFSVRAYSGDK